VPEPPPIDLHQQVKSVEPTGGPSMADMKQKGMCQNWCFFFNNFFKYIFLNIFLAIL
jgi:hypothetical protein